MVKLVEGTGEGYQTYRKREAEEGRSSPAAGSPAPSPRVVNFATQTEQNLFDGIGDGVVVLNLGSYT